MLACQITISTTFGIVIYEQDKFHAQLTELSMNNRFYFPLTWSMCAHWLIVLVGNHIVCQQVAKLDL